MVLGIYCAGGFGGVAMELAKELNEQTKRWNSICFISDVEVTDRSSEQVFSFNDFSFKYSPADAEIVIASGEPQGRKKLFQRVKSAGYSLPNLIHPMSKSSNISEIGEGNIILDFAYVSASGVHIGNNNIIMPFSQIGHDNVIGNHCVIASSATISGRVLLEDCCYIGTGAKLREDIVVKHDAIIGMGAIAVKPVDAESVVMGVPAKEVRKNTGSVFK